MNTAWRGAIALITVVLGVSLYFGLRNTEDTSASGGEPAITESSSTPTTTAPTNPGTYAITIAADAGTEPSPVTIDAKVGDTVTLDVTSAMIAHFGIYEKGDPNAAAPAKGVKWSDGNDGGIVGDPVGKVKTLKFAVTAPGTFSIQLHADQAYEIGTLTIS
jgi:FtsP/CotA-like multicopper oxidase with cupredoxin domain